MRKKLLLQVSLLALVLLVGALTSFKADGTRGLIGSGIGALFGMLLCAISHHFVARAKAAEGARIVEAMMAGMIASFVLLAGGVLTVTFVWNEVSYPVALVAMAFYMVYRFFEASEMPKSDSAESAAKPSLANRPPQD